MARILLVDDNEEMLFNLSALLRHEGHEVDAVNTGLDAMDRLQSVETYDLLVTDLRMAPVDGVEVIHTARAERPDMEIIVVSGELEHGALAELEELGCHMQIAKPFHPDDVLLSIRQIIA